MKKTGTHHIWNRAGLLAAVSLLTTFNIPPLAVFAQGSFTPPGPPGPTFKTLTQIEPRTAITGSGAVTLSQAGSYYLTTNITVNTGDAITITVNNVTLDLNGFTISSRAPSANGTAILLSGGRTNITIGNGHISSGVAVAGGVFSGGGFGSGIHFTDSSPRNARIFDVTVSGVLYYGIYLDGRATSIQSCVVDVAGDTGLVAGIVTDSFADNCGIGSGINGGTVNNCTGNSISSGYGILANSANNANGSSASGSGVYVYQTADSCSGVCAGSGYGLFTAHSANNCRGSSSTGIGLFAGDVAGNSLGTTDVSGAGLHANTANNCLGYTPTGGTGLDVTVATGCWGVNQGSGDGIHASINAQNCYGSSLNGFGVFTTIAQNCYGYTFGGVNGVKATIAIGCYGQSGNNYGVWADNIAVACSGISRPGITDGAHGGRMYNMPCAGCP